MPPVRRWRVQQLLGFGSRTLILARSLVRQPPPPVPR
jgi:hypothetical protein